jgi:hypothetical protein
MRTVLAALCATLALPAGAAPRLAGVACEIGEKGRTRLFSSRAREEDADDELHCRASLRGLGGRSATDLVAELRVLPPGGPFRVVASQPLSPADADGARLQPLLVPSTTWISAVDWRARGGPRIRLVLTILDKPSPGQKRWRVVATRNLELRR